MGKKKLEELNLRDLIDILIRRFKIILGAILIMIIVVAVYIYVIQDTVYEARATISVVRTDETEERSIGGSVEDLLESITHLNALNRRNLGVVVRSAEVIERALEEGNLSDRFSPEEVSGKLSLTFHDESNLVTLSVRDQNPESAANLVNAVSVAFVEKIRQEISETAAENLAFIESQLEIERNTLDEVLEREKDFVSQARGIRDLNRELDRLSDQLADYRVDIRNLEAQYEGLRAAVESLEGDLASETRGTEAYALIADQRARQRALMNQTSAELETKKELVEGITDDLREVRILYSTLESEQRGLFEEIERRVEIYDLFTAKYQEIKIIKEFEASDTLIGLTSEAHTPSMPIGTNRRMILMIAGFLGLIFGVVAAFGKEYWENTKPESKSPSNSAGNHS